MIRNQERLAIGAGALQSVLAAAAFILAQGHEAAALAGHIYQAGNLVLVGGLVSFLAAFHAYLARLADEERRDNESLKERDANLFSGELEMGRQQRALRSFTRIILPLLLMGISLAETVPALWIARLVNASDPRRMPMDTSFLPAAALLGAGAIVCFVSGKYCAGAASGGRLLFLRPVCGRLLLSAVACLIGAVAALAAHWHFPLIAQWTVWLGCLAAVALVGERIATWIVDLYRPQSRRIADRPVYESRFLALFGQPRGFFASLADMVDYQFGFQISERRLYRFLGRAVLPFLLIQIVTLFLLTAIVHVGPREKGLGESWGSAEPVVLEPGIHLMKPWPATWVSHIPTESIQQITVGTEWKATDAESGSDLKLWLERAGGRDLVLAAGKRGGGDVSAEPRTRPAAVNLGVVGITVHFRVSDAQTFFKAHHQPVALLRHVSRRALSGFLLSRDFSELLRDDISGVDDELERLIEDGVAKHDLGIEIVFVGIERLEPPPSVAPAFRDVLNAREERRQLLVAAEQFAIEELAAAAAEANEILSKARAETARITKLAAVERVNFLQQSEIYRRYPKLYRNSRWMDYLETWLPSVRKVVMTFENGQDVINIHLKKERPSLLDLDGLGQ